jgi:hypothetical protein
MLRSLINDPNDARDGQPKTRKQMSAGELRYVDEKAPARERELWRSRARAQAKEAALDLAAEALARKAARQGGEE